MVGLKVCLLFLLFALAFANKQRYNDRRGFHQMLQDEDSEELKQDRRKYEDDGSEEKKLSHRVHEQEDDDDDKPYLELRASSKTPSNKGPVITLQNRAAMNTRLRVLYTDAGCNPFIAETGRLLVGQTKSVTIPTYAEHVKILVEKDMFMENWSLAYNGTLDANSSSQCVRITGITLKSTIKPCK